MKKEKIVLDKKVVKGIKKFILGNPITSYWYRDDKIGFKIWKKTQDTEYIVGIVISMFFVHYILGASVIPYMGGLFVLVISVLTYRQIFERSINIWKSNSDTYYDSKNRGYNEFGR